MTPDDAMGLAAELLGRPVASAEPVARGGNNRIFRIGGDQGFMALKSYPPQTEDPRDRLGQEWAALTFLDRHRLPVPAPIAASPRRHVALYSWLDGAPAGDCDPDVVAPMGDFFARLQALRHDPAASTLREGSTPVFSAAQAAAQLDQRLAPLEGIAGLTGHLYRLRRTAQRAVGRARDMLGAAFDTPSPRDRNVLSPSDFGRHNMLVSDAGTFFLDFEYFGWDGPEKAISDAVLHPGSGFSQPQRDRLRALMQQALPDDKELPSRLDAMLPLFGLIWCLILLNEFRPDRMARRGLVEGMPETEAARARQLDKSQALLSWLEDAHDLAPA